MASVRKRKWTHKGVEREAWVVSYTDQGGKRRLKTFDKKKEADAYRAQADSGELIHNKLTVRQKTFGQALDAWWEDIELRHQVGEVSGNYRFSMKQMLNRHVRPGLASLKLHELSRDHVQDWLDGLITRYAKETCKHALIPVHGALRMAVRKRWIARNPLADDPVKVRDRPPRPRAIPDKEQIAKLLNYIAHRQKNQSELSWYRSMLIFTLGLFQGMRIGEICGLQWADVDMERMSISIRHSYSRFDGLKAPKTAAGIRTLPMSDPTAKLLRLLASSPKYGEAKGYVYRSNTNQPIAPDRARRDTFYHTMSRAGLAAEPFKGWRARRPAPLFNLHSLRHAALSMLAEQGIPPLHLKNIAGHKSITTTMDIYGHLFPTDDADRRIMGLVSQQFTPATRPLLPAPPQH